MYLYCRCGEMRGLFVAVELLKWWTL